MPMLNMADKHAYDEVQIAVSIINTSDSGPELLLVQPGCGVRSSLARVWAVMRTRVSYLNTKQGKQGKRTGSTAPQTER